MNCPTCTPARALAAVELEAPWLIAHECDGCGGHWISATAYREFWTHHPKNLPERPAAAGESRAADGPYLRRCPECDYILGRFRVGRGIPFTLDQCRNCGGAWFDAGEWQALRDRNLHDDLHFILSDDWQDEVRRLEQAAREEAWEAEGRADRGLREEPDA